VTQARKQVFLLCVLTAAAASTWAVPARPRRTAADLHTAIALTQAHLYGATGLIARASATAPEADVLLLVSEKTWNAVRSRIAARKIAVRFEDARSGYLRVTVPLTDVRTLFEWPEIDAARVDGLAAYDTRVQHQMLQSVGFPPRGSVTTRSSPKPPKMRPLLTADAARRHPINGDQDMGVTTFRAENPTFDGRGIGIGVLERTAIPVDHPAYRSARALDGTPRRKILRHLGHTGARRDGTGAPLSPWFDCRSPVCEVQGDLLRLPGAGRYRIACVTLDRRTLQGPRAVRVVVLQRETDRRLFVDANGDLDLSDETPLIDFNTASWDERSIVALDSPNGVTVKVVVSIDTDGVFAWLHPFTQGHATMTSTVAAGSDEEKNLAVGVAPSASLIFVDAGVLGLLSQALEGLITLARDPDVDVISAAIVASTPLGTRESFDSLAFDRISEAYDKPVILSSGNYTAPIFSSAAPGGRVAMAVGQYINPKTTEALHGVMRPEVPVVASTVGPMVDGSPKPDFLAASKRVAAAPCDVNQTNSLQTQYTLPPCYTISGGTSAAGPSAAGAVALLISAAKQRQLKHGVFDIRQALMASAAHVPGVPIHMQGAGLINLPRAWVALQSPPPGPIPGIQVDGELRHPFVNMLGGVAAHGLLSVDSSEGDRSLTLTVRSDGRARTNRLAARAEGSLHTTLPVTVDFDPLGVARLPVKLAAPAPGRVESAWITLSAGRTTVGLMAVAGRPAALIAPAFEYRWTHRVGIETHQETLLQVPDDVTGMLVEAELTQGDGAPVLKNPISLPMLPRSYWSGGPFFSTPVVSVPGRYAGVLLDPSSGTWGVSTLERSTILTAYWASTDERPVSVHVEFRISAFRTACQLVERHSASANDGVRVAIKDVFAKPVNGSVLAAPARVETTRVIPRDEFERRAVEIEVQPGTALLQIRARQSGGDGVMLQLFDCTLGHCLSEIQSVPGQPLPTLNLREPRAGKWKVFAVPIKPLYEPTPIDVTVTQAMAADIRSLAPAPVAEGSSGADGVTTFAGEIPRRADASGVLAFRTDARAALNKEGWGAVSACVMEAVPPIPARRIIR
jgi:Subtilase family